MGGRFFLRGGRRRPARAVALVLVLLAAACDFAVGTETGQRDADFGDEGAAFLDGIRVRTDDTMTSSARMPDGRVVSVGSSPWAEPWALTQFRTDGSLDRSFGRNGVVSVPLDPMGHIAVASDGAILVPGRTQNSEGEFVWGVARFRSNGERDVGFGANGLAVLDAAGASGQNWPIGVAGNAERTYVLGWTHPVGTTSNDTIVLAVGPDGELDPDFGPDGRGILRITNAGESGAIDIGPDGNVVVSYASRGSGATIAGVVRISPAGEVLGRLDLATLATPTPIRAVEDMDVAADGSVALAVIDDYGEPTSYAVRVTATLTLDTSFGGGAVSLGQSSIASEILVDDATGRIVVAEQRRAVGDFVTAALAADGSPDPAWGDGGIAVHATWTTQTTAAGLFPTADGVLIAGQTSESTTDPKDLYLLALDATGDGDPDFGDDGWARADVGVEATEDFTAVAALPGGDLLVAGNLGSGFETGDGVVAGRYDADGTPDADNPPARLLPERLRGPHYVTDVAVAENGSAFVLARRGNVVPSEIQFGAGSFTWVVVKLDADGAVDETFGDDGVAAVGGSPSLPLAIAVRADGTVLASVLDITPARIIPPRQFVPATFTDRIVALTPTGAPAGTTTFGTTSNTPPGMVFDAMAAGPDGDAYVVANRQVQRVAPDGTVSAWGPLPAGAALTPTDLAVDGEGRVLVYGSGNVPGGPPGDVVARFDAALGLDTTFGTGGLTGLKAPDQITGNARDVHGHPGGSVTIVHQGWSASGADPHLLVHRLLPSGQPDPSFSGDGLAEGALPLGWLRAPSTASTSTIAGSDVILAGRTAAGAFATRVNG